MASSFYISNHGFCFQLAVQMSGNFRLKRIHDYVLQRFGNNFDLCFIISELFELLHPISNLLRVRSEPERLIRLLNQYIRLSNPQISLFATQRNIECYRGLITEFYPDFEESDLDIFCKRVSSTNFACYLFNQIAEIVFDRFY